eukprot:2796811-Alexandrium_andersonii.AAC.1
MAAGRSQGAAKGSCSPRLVGIALWHCPHLRRGQFALARRGGPRASACCAWPCAGAARCPA